MEKNNNNNNKHMFNKPSITMKQFKHLLLAGALTAGLAGFAVSCNKYGDDINDLNERLEAVETLSRELQTQIQNGAVITNVSKTDKGVIVTLSNGNSFELTNGAKGADGAAGSVISINEEGYWCIDGKPTEYKAQGEKGEKGEKGDQGEKGEKGDQGEPGKAGSSTSPSVYYYPGTTGSEDGYWVKVTVAADGTETKEVTNMKWTVTSSGSEIKGVIAIWSDGKLILRNVDGYDGDLTITLKGDLRSLVFRPEMVLDGQNAMEYIYIPYKPFTVNKEIAGGMLVHQVQTATGYEPKETTYKLKGEAVQATAWSFLNPTQSKDYWLNPTEAVIDTYTQANLTVDSKDVDFMVTRANAAASKPTAVYRGIEADKESGDRKMVVGITMNGVNVKTQEESDRYDLGIFYPAKKDDSKITDLAVQAPIQTNGEVITSTYASVYASQYAIEAIAYNTSTYANSYIIATKQFDTDVLVGKEAVHATPMANGRHLYFLAKDAAEQSATVELAYNNATGIDLNELVTTHVGANSMRSWNTVATRSMTNAQLKDLGLKYNFERVNFSIGSNATEQSQNHAVLETGANGHTYIIACGVESNSDTDILNCQPDLSLKAKAVSSVGRTPLVRVELKDTVNNKIVKVGYIKFKIVAPENPLETPNFNLGNFFYQCGATTKTVTWHAIESKLLEATRNTSKETFDATYEIVKSEDGTVTQFVKTTTVDVNGKPTWTNATPVGSILEVANDGAETTDVISWTINRNDFVTFATNAAYPEVTVTRWVKYVPKKYLGNSNFNVEPVYLPIQITLCYPKAIMANKIARYWYAENSMNPTNDALDPDQRLFLHANVEVPGTTTDENDASCNFMFALDSRFELNTVGHSDLQQTLDSWVPNYVCLFGTVSNAVAENAPNFTVAPNAWVPSKAWNTPANFPSFSDNKELVYFYYFNLGAANTKTVKVVKDTYEDKNGNLTKEVSYKLSVANTTPNSPVMLYSDNLPYEFRNVVLFANNTPIAEIHYNLESNHTRKHGAWLEIKNNAAAKDLLNVPTEWTASSTSDAAAVTKLLKETLDVEIAVAAFNKTCGAYLPLTGNVFGAEILKPVYTVPNGPVEFINAKDNGDAGTKIDLATLVSFYDWRQYDFRPSNLDYYNYYGVSDISVDPQEIRTNITGKMTALKYASLDLEFHVVRGGVQVDNGYVTTTAAGVPVANATWNQILSHFGQLTYTNNTGTIVDFDIEIPVKVTHKWSPEGYIVWVKGHVGRSQAN